MDDPCVPTAAEWRRLLVMALHCLGGLRPIGAARAGDPMAEFCAQAWDLVRQTDPTRQEERWVASEAWSPGNHDRRRKEGLLSVVRASTPASTGQPTASG